MELLQIILFALAAALCNAEHVLYWLQKEGYFIYRKSHLKLFYAVGLTIYFITCLVIKGLANVEFIELMIPLLSLGLTTYMIHFILMATGLDRSKY
ncbi:hypothetical protein [Rubellicoccus peritrichatus]|uniref:Uncharacterized protein n=1 Tax=Rubellicoccus peritrichatus TaxID=3080537 RepID=A0AAQ3LE65_9BACT|nr:hypothetical protein [Puniceicoccus sp. CR14]WOO41938.1 hypothetical protein RZN69_02475 [Puniceicoccus sp. CR14]